MAIYYIKSGGNDSFNGLSDANAWGSVSKITSGSFSAGDQILIKNDGGVYDVFSVPSSGSSGNPITIGTYDTGAQPTCRGGVIASGWNNEGGNIYSFQHASMIKDPKMVRFDGNLKPRGRSQLYTISSASATEDWVETNDFKFTVSEVSLLPVIGSTYTNNSSTFYITDVNITGGSGTISARRTSGSNNPSASGTLTRSNGLGAQTITFSAQSIVELPEIDYSGVHIVVRNRRFIYRTSTDIEKSSNRITYGDDLSDKGLYNVSAGYGFFLQNHMSFLTNDGDWMYDTATNTLYMYFADNTPSNHEVFIAVQDYIVNINNRNYVNIDGIKFEGSISHGIRRNNTSRVHITNCEIAWCGDNGIANSDNTSTYCNANNNKIHDCHANGIYVDYLCNNMEASNNEVYNCGLYPGGALYYGNNDSKGLGICLQLGANNKTNNNHVHHIGFNGIVNNGSGFQIEDNIVEYYNLTKDDGSGIYCSLGGTGTQLTTAGSIRRNKCLHGVGNNVGANDTAVVVFGIYMDDLQNKVEIENNLMAYNAGAGLYLHNTDEITVQYNVFFGNQRGLNLSQDSSLTIRDTIFKYNTIYCVEPEHFTVSCYSQVSADLDDFGDFDYNKYVYLENHIGLFEVYGGDKYNYGVSFDEWKTVIAGETNSICIAYQSYIPTSYTPSATLWSRTYDTDGSQSGGSTGQFSLFGGGTRTWAGGKAVLTKTSSGKRDAYMGIGSVTANNNYILTVQVDSPSTQYVSLIPEYLFSTTRKRKRIKSSSTPTTYKMMFQIVNSRASEQMLWLFENGSDAAYNIDNVVFERLDNFTFDSDIILISNTTSSPVLHDFEDQNYKNLDTNYISNKFTLAPNTYAVLQKTDEEPTPIPEPEPENPILFPFVINLI